MPPARRFLAELPHRGRVWLAAWPERWRAWRAELREDPTVLWRTPAIRLGGLALAGIALLAAAHVLTAALTPAAAPGALQAPTRTATLYVACTNPACLTSFVTRQPMDFRDWPLECPQCGQSSVYRATVCRACGQWFATVPGSSKECPHCAARAAQATRPALKAPSASSDDDEDPW